MATKVNTGIIGNNNVIVTTFDFVIDGTALGDVITGGSGNDTLRGNGGNDRLFGGAGNDILDGGEGDDFMVGGAGADTFRGGIGFDTVSYAPSSLGVTIDARGQGVTNDAKGDTFSGIDKIVGTDFGDVIIAGVGFVDFSHGNSGGGLRPGMVLDGGKGADFLTGSIGNDSLIGGAGDDTLRGGDSSVPTVFADQDTFVIGLNTGTDLIVDFDARGDTLAIQGITRSNALGNDGELARGTRTADGHFVGNIDIGDNLFYDTAHHVLYAINPDFFPGSLSPISIATDPNAHVIAHFGNNYDLRTSDLDFI